MPHIILEYSANLEADLDMPELGRALHRAAIATGVFPIGGTRTRLAPRAVYFIGDEHINNRFIHLQLRIARGRPDEVRQKVAEEIFNILKAKTAEVFAHAPLGLTIEIVEMNPVGALKHNNLHEIIAARQAAQTR